MTVSPPPTDTDRPDPRYWRCARCHRAPEQHAGGREADDCVYLPELVDPAVLDPREVALVAVRNMAFDWYCPSDERHPRVNCRECIADVALNAYEAAARLDHGIAS